MNKEKRTNKSGFSLLELIVVISIMAVLGGVLAPQLVRYVDSNRATACKTDRESILAVYERCIYGQTKDLDTAALQQVLSGSDPATKDEVFQYDECPSSGDFTGEVIVNPTTGVHTAIIHCDHPGHEDVVVDFIGWGGTEYAEGIDDPLPPPPSSSEPETDEEESEEEPTTIEAEEHGYWPYDDDGRWEGKRFPGQYVEVPVPSGLFTSKEGNTYVIIDRSGGTGVFPVYYEWNLGPENIDTRGWEHCISWSGVVIEDIESIMYKRWDEGKQAYVKTGSITGVHYGDIVVYKGLRYIYGSHDESMEKPLPIEGANGNNFYLVDP